MSVRIRVYPQYGARGMYGGMGGLYGRNGYAGTRLAQQQLTNERRTSSLRLQYERQLWAERLKLAQLQAQVQYGGYGGVQNGMYGGNAFANSYMGMGALGFNPMTSGTGFFGGLGLGGLF